MIHQSSRFNHLQENKLRESSLLLKALICATLIALAGSPLFAGVVFQVETTYHSGGGGAQSSEMSVETPNLKMEILPGKDGSAGEVSAANWSV